jgi:hypothetical protein
VAIRATCTLSAVFYNMLWRVHEQGIHYGHFSTSRWYVNKDVENKTATGNQFKIGWHGPDLTLESRRHSAMARKALWAAPSSSIAIVTAAALLTCSHRQEDPHVRAKISYFL